MTTLAELRAQVAAVLTDAIPALKALDYVSENITPPCYVVVPGQPYLSTEGTDLPFGMTRVKHHILILVGTTGAKVTAARIDELIGDAFAALNAEFDVTDVAQPGTVTVSGTKYTGSILTIQHDEKL